MAFSLIEYPHECFATLIITSTVLSQSTDIADCMGHMSLIMHNRKYYLSTKTINHQQDKTINYNKLSK